MNICAIILAAGLSSRMGVLKPLLKTGDNILISHLTELFCAAGVDAVFIVLGYRGAEIEAAVRNSAGAEALKRTRFIFNSDYEEEMLTSVSCGVKAVLETYDDNSCCGAFIIPADYPLLKTETVVRLVNEVRQEQDGGKLIYPVKDNIKGHPPFIHMDILRQIPQKQDGGLRAFLEPFSSVNIHVDDDGILVDMDTPEAYASILNKQGLKTYPAPAEALALLESLGIAGGIISHGQAVGALALKIADLAASHGYSMDRELIYSAGILHDMGKGAENHAQEGFRMLMERGFPDAARIVRVHMDIEERFLHMPCPEAIVYLADKMTLGQEYTTLDKRMEYKKLNNPDAIASGHRRMNNAEIILETLLKACGLRKEEFYALTGVL